MTETENPTPNPDFEAAVQEKLRQEQKDNNANPVIELPEDSVEAPDDAPPDETVTEGEPEVTKEEETEKDVQAQHQNILTPEHYLGSEKVNPDNPMLEHMKPEDYYANANKENR